MTTIGSLFTGYGGLDQAAEAVFGARTVWTSDIDPGACKIIGHRYPTLPNHGDITTIDWTTVEPVDILTGGFPCQDLSMAGKRAGMRPGTRSGLWEHMAYAINQLRPRYVIAENVRGLLSGTAHSDVEPCPWCLGDRPDGHLRALGAVLGDLANLGYDARWYGLRAADIGAPHGRFRVFILATAQDADRTAGDQRRIATPRQAETRRPRADTGGRGRAPDPVALLPTPGANDAESSVAHKGGNPTLGAAQLLPTPNAIDAGGGPKRLRADGRTEADHGPQLRDVAAHLLPTPVVSDSFGGRNATSGRKPGSQHHSGTTLTDVAYVDRFGQYSDAINRWQPIICRPAPDPTTNGRLSPRFVEWLMGLPDGWVTDVPNMRRAEQLKALGNGVVPQQAAAALQHMISMQEVTG